MDRETVLGAARELFGERGFEGTTLAAIAGRVGLSPAALLRHAPTKQALFEAAFSSPDAEFRLPIEFLAEVDAATASPTRVLRRVGEAFVPFFDRILGQTFTLWMRTNALVADAPDRVPLLFDRGRRPTPPERALALVESYFRRATKAGKLRLRDPRAAAIAFLGSLQAYVLLHRVAKAVDPPMPLARYLDSLLDVWVRGPVAREGSR